MRRSLAEIPMTTAPETSVTILTRTVQARTTKLAGRFPAASILHAIGSRSEAVRLAPVVTALHGAGAHQRIARLLPSGRPDEEILDEAGMPRTELLVDARSGTDIQRAAYALAVAENALTSDPPTLLVLAGDAESSLAFGLAASKLGVPIARLGGGLRSGDFSENEEINRILGDRLADIVFADTTEARDALEVEGIDAARVILSGSTVADLLVRWEGTARRRATWQRLGLASGRYAVVTLHRAENVANHERMARITAAIASLSRRIPVVFPLHPWTRARMEPMGDVARLEAAGVRVTSPLSYMDFLSLALGAGAILTDSGGVQDEAAMLGVPCYTVRRVTERVATLTHGSNVLLGDDPAEIEAIELRASPLARAAIPLWDGRAAGRIATELRRWLETDGNV
jgi:UDP-N-acetylglucosamine 2-epimerase (non-hydrolysing)